MNLGEGERPNTLNLEVQNEGFLRNKFGGNYHHGILEFSLPTVVEIMGCKEAGKMKL